jgi:DNA-directed RNA polymerase sigma subunit (sigma70/sigma32)
MATDELSEIKVDVGVLKTQVLTLSSICNKLDQVIEKLVDQHDRHISKVYDDMNSNRKEKDADISEMHQRIDAVLDKVEHSEKRIMQEIRGLKETMADHVEASRNQYDRINQWKWTIAGGIIVITWLISHSNFDTILKALR